MIVTRNHKKHQKHFNCQLSGEIATTKNKMASHEYSKGISYSAILNGNYLFKEKIKVGIFSDYSKSNRYTSESLDYFFYGASLYYNPNNKLNFNVNYRNNFPLEEDYKTNSIFNLDFKYKINEKNAFNLVANFSHPLNSNDKDIFVSLKYSISLDVAISKDKNLGNLKGQIKSIDNDDVQMCNGENPEQLYIYSEVTQRVNKVIASLPLKCQLVFRLIKEEGLSYKEVSKVLEISQNTIETHMRIALRKIRLDLKHFLHK